jgi:hypothetical protein
VRSAVLDAASDVVGQDDLVSAAGRHRPALSAALSAPEPA